MPYEVKLDVYEGPFDLLLQLIARRKLDVTEIDLGDITAEFLAHLDASIGELDLDTATRFLVVAATLVELKAARLLPREDREELEDLLGEARDLLYARLLEYRAYRDVARVLSHHLVSNEWVLGRDVPPEPWVQRLVPDTRLTVDASGLAALASAVLDPRPDAPVDVSHIRRSYLSIREAAEQVLTALRRPDEATSFRTLAAERDRGDRVVLFLACLELFKLGHVALEQPDHHQPFTVARRVADDELAAVLDGVDDSDLEDGDLEDGDVPDSDSADAGSSDVPGSDPGDPRRHDSDLVDAVPTPGGVR